MGIFDAFNMFSINIPYPRVGSFTNTWVTAPTSLPFCIILLSASRALYALGATHCVCPRQTAEEQSAAFALISELLDANALDYHAAGNSLRAYQGECSRLPDRRVVNKGEHNYLISCSKFSKSLVLKNSIKVIPNPSQSIFIVTIPGFLLLPYKMFFIEEGATADSIASL